MDVPVVCVSNLKQFMVCNKRDAFLSVLVGVVSVHLIIRLKVNCLGETKVSCSGLDEYTICFILFH